MQISFTESEFKTIEEFYLRMKNAQPKVIRVNAGGNLQKAIDEAQSGETILTEPGASYPGNFILPFRNHEKKVRITSRLDRVTERIIPGDPVSFLASTNTTPVLRTAPATSGWEFTDVEFVPGQNSTNILQLGVASSAQSHPDTEPTRIDLHRTMARPDGKNIRRVLFLCAGKFTLMNSHWDGVAQAGADSMCILGANCTGEHTIGNNFLEASTENIIYGGEDARSPELVPTGIEIFKNIITKRESWRTGTSFRFKNLLELKGARKVNIYENGFSNHWNEFAFWWKSVDQSDATVAPWMVVEDVNFYRNICTDISSGFNLHRNPEGTAQPMKRINIYENIIDISRARWGGRGQWLAINGVDDLSIIGNRVMQDGDNTITFEGLPCERFRLMNNEFPCNNLYGIKGAGTTTGIATLEKFAPGYVVTGNKIRTSKPNLYPPNNIFWN